MFDYLTICHLGVSYSIHELITHFFFSTMYTLLLLEFSKFKYLSDLKSI